MSALFFKISLPQNVAKYRRLQTDAKHAGQTLRVKNASRTRGLPVFLFYISHPNGDGKQCFSDLDEVQAALVTLGGEA